MTDRNAAMYRAIQQLTQQQNHQQQQQPNNHSRHGHGHTHNGSSAGGRPSLSSIIEMVSRGQNHAVTERKSVQNNSHNNLPLMNGTASAMEFASSTGSGGTWQRDNNSTANGNSFSNGFGNTSANSGFSMMTGMNNMPPPILFKCSECAISKTNCEDLEIHIKTEHLNWLPFRCQFCPAQRASDTQMREHVYSSHKRDDNKYTYMDNPHAKRKLTQMLDRALILATAALAAKKTGSAAALPTNGNGISQPQPKRPRLDNQLVDNSDIEMQPRASATVTVLPRSNNTSDILAQLTAARNDNEEVAGQIEDNFNVTESAHDEPGELDELTSNQLSQLFGSNGNNLTSEFDEDYTDTSFADNDASKSLIENIHALFGSAPSTPDVFNGTKQKTKTSRAPRNMHSVSKKRVLGECSRCQKPVTAGARQMHMFYHLAKDQNTYRFKCKFDNCDVQHYRKDQMENHMSKMHGRIDPDMMEDRSSQLHDIVQVLSMELLGTSGNAPGPTAERAQTTYNNMQREAFEANKKKRRLEQGNDGNSSFASTSGGFPDGLPTMVKPEPRLEEQIECMLCQKYIVARTRGFHLLWHLNNDLNIVRYHCKHCDFKHDRSQSISNHGIREHNDEKCVIDTIGKYDEEIRSMSKACFGIEQPFTKESSRSRRIKREAEGKPKIEEILFPHDLDLDATELDENDQLSETHSETSDEHKSGTLTLSPMPKTEIQSPAKGEQQQQSSFAWAARKKTTRRFGTRKPKSRKQKQEMAQLRELSMVLGGAQYFKKKAGEAALCAKCGKVASAKLVHHAYQHIEDSLFECSECHLGNPVREIVCKHMKDLHSCYKPPIDNRLKFANEIKESIRECYPEFFVDAPIPTHASIEKLKQSLGIQDELLVGLEQDQQSDNEEQEQENSQFVEDEEGNNATDATMDETVDFALDEETPETEEMTEMEIENENHEESVGLEAEKIEEDEDDLENGQDLEQVDE